MYNGVNWTWISGSNQFDSCGLYSGPNPMPGGRFNSVGWRIDGELWIFGGFSMGVATYEGCGFGSYLHFHALFLFQAVLVMFGNFLEEGGCTLPAAVHLQSLVHCINFIITQENYE